MIIPNYNKLGIYMITLVIIILGVIGIVDTPNDEFVLEGAYLLMVFIPMIIQMLYLCSEKDVKSQKSEVKK